MKAVDDKLPPRSIAEIEADLLKIFGSGQRAHIAAFIERLPLLASYPPLAGYERSNKKFARRLKAWLEAGGTIFANMPNDFPPLALFALPDRSPCLHYRTRSIRSSEFWRR